MDEPAGPAGLQPVPPALAGDLGTWAQALREAAGPAFRALYVHGSALLPGFDTRQSDVNLLLVLSELPFERLARLAQAVRSTAEASKGRPRFSPLVLTEWQVQTSADVFPAEFLDLGRRRALVEGEDVLGAVVVGRGNLRHQCEYELRSKLVGLRQAFLLAGGAPGTAGRLLVQAAGGLAAVLRHLLTLRGEAAPEDLAALAAAVARAYGVDATALDAPFAARRTPAGDDTARTLFAQHLTVLESLTAAVDAFPAT